MFYDQRGWLKSSFILCEVWSEIPRAALLIFTLFLFLRLVCYLTELKNDHKEVTEKIDKNIQALHSVRLAPKSSSVEDSGRC